MSIKCSFRGRPSGWGMLHPYATAVPGALNQRRGATSAPSLPSADAQPLALAGRTKLNPEILQNYPESRVWASPTSASTRMSNNPQTVGECSCGAEPSTVPGRSSNYNTAPESSWGLGGGGGALPGWPRISSCPPPARWKWQCCGRGSPTLAGRTDEGRQRSRRRRTDGAAALADWRADTHFLFAAHNLPNEACHSPSPPFNSSLPDCH